MFFIGSTFSLIVYRWISNYSFSVRLTSEESSEYKTHWLGQHSSRKNSEKSFERIVPLNRRIPSLFFGTALRQQLLLDVGPKHNGFYCFPVCRILADAALRKQPLDGFNFALCSYRFPPLSPLLTPYFWFFWQLWFCCWTQDKSSFLFFLRMRGWLFCEVISLFFLVQGQNCMIKDNIFMYID